MPKVLSPGGPLIFNDLYEQAPLTERTLAKAVKPDGHEGCWIWTGFSQGGYGKLKTTPGTVYAHRLFYFKLVGPTDLTLDHLCRNTMCVNPAHLEPVTHAENVRRGESGKAIRARTHCPQGHPYEGANLMLTRKGERLCKTCKNDSQRRAYWAKRSLELTPVKP